MKHAVAWVFSVAFGVGGWLCGGCGGSNASDTARGNHGESGDAGATQTARRICDGSDGIRLAYWTEVDPSRVLAATPVLYELGEGFLYVNGRCHYWVQQPSSPPEYQVWRGYREGDLTPSQEATLHDVTAYDDFANAGLACRGTAAFDGSPIVFWDGSVERDCAGQLSVKDNWPLRDLLFASGTPMTGAMRIEVGNDGAPVPDDAPLYEWPLQRSPRQLVVDVAGASQFGHSIQVTDPTDIAALRTLQQQAIADAEQSPGYFYGVVYVKPRGYAVAMRDDLPFSRAQDGRWDPPSL